MLLMIGLPFRNRDFPTTSIMINIETIYVMYVASVIKIKLSIISETKVIKIIKLSKNIENYICGYFIAYKYVFC